MRRTIGHSLDWHEDHFAIAIQKAEPRGFDAGSYARPRFLCILLLRVILLIIIPRLLSGERGLRRSPDNNSRTSCAFGNWAKKIPGLIDSLGPVKPYRGAQDHDG